MKNTYFLRLRITVLTVIFLFLGAAGTVSAANFTVTKIADTNDGVCNADCSLREAVSAANSVGSDDTIDFAASLSGQTITLSNALPDILVVNAGSLSITGLGANKLTIDGGAGTTRIFTVNSAVFSLSGVTLSGGNGASAFLGSGDGGAVFVLGGTAVFDSVYFTNNTGAALGGALYFNGGANHLITNSTFSGNNAGNFGAVMVDVSAPLNVYNSTFSGNSTAGVGGALGVVNSGSLTLRNDTIASNTAANGGGVFVQGGTLNFGNTIIAGNTATTNFPEILFAAGTVTSAGNNLVGDSAGDSVNTGTPIPYQPSDIQNVSPQLMALGNYGGPTPTRALQFSSPARNNGSDGLASAAGLVYDQRGPSFLRFIGTVDIGAFEVQDARFYVTKTADSNDGACNDDCSLREAVAAAPNGGSVDFSRSLSGQTIVLTGGEIVINKILTIDGFGANLLEISGNNTSRIFTIGGVAVKITGVKLSGGNSNGINAGFGGAILVNGGSLNLDAVDVTNNTASAFGGGVFIANSTNSRIGYSTISFNTAPSCAGVDLFTSTVYVVNSTISDNIASNFAGGMCLASSSATLRNTTITSNSANTAGGISVDTSTLNFGNTIVAGNFATFQPEILFSSGTVTSAGNNLVGDSAGDAQNTNLPITYQMTDILNTNPQLGPLTVANGGTTPTRALGPLSPAIDRGSNSLAVDQGNIPLIIDQRGFTRIVDGNFDSVAVVDIGAYEFASAVPTAANVSVSGYVLNGKSGISRARVTMTDSNGNVRTATTNSFGSYHFDDVTVGETYTFEVFAKGYQFAPQIVTVNEELTELNFTPQE